MLTFEKKTLKHFKNGAKAKKFGVKKVKSLQLCLNLTVMAFKVLFKTFSRIKHSCTLPKQDSHCDNNKTN